MILFFHLDISQELSDIAGTKGENIRIIFSGNQLFSSNAIGSQKSILRLVFGDSNLRVSSFWRIIAAIRVITVAGWDLTVQYIRQRSIVGSLLFLKSLKQIFQFRILGLLSITSIFFDTAFFLCLYFLLFCNAFYFFA